MSTPSIKVAFATTDMNSVNQHFGSAKSFALYEVNQQESRFLEVVQFADSEQDGNEDKLMSKIAALQNCSAVYCQAVGASAIRKLLCCGIQPMKVYEGSKIKRLLSELQEDLLDGNSAWLAKALKKQQEQSLERFAAMQDEAWEE